MKKILKKAITVIGSTFLVGSTVAMAAAAAYPAPFVQNGVADVAIVYGSNAASSDIVGASNIQSDLSTALAGQTTSGSTGGSVASGGESIKLERSSNLFNLGEELNDFYSSLDEGELPTVLAKGEYLDDDNDKYEYDQDIVVADGLALTHFLNDDLQDQPIIGFDLTDGTAILNYTLDFTPDDVADEEGNWGDLEQTEIDILGKEYFISSATNASGAQKLVLLDTANAATIVEGETSTLSVAGTSYDVSIEFIDSSNVMLNVNGETTNKLAEGDTFEITEDVFVAVKTNLYTEKESGISKAEVSIGEGEIVLENGQEVEINDEDVDGLDVVITGTTELDKITLVWALDDDMWITPDEKLVLPGFGTIEVSMAGFNTVEQEEVVVKNSGDAVKLTAPIEDGTVNVEFIYGNGTLFEGVGEESGKELLTSAGDQVVITDASKQKFLASWTDGTEVESYVLEVSKITDSDPAKNTTTIRSVVDSNVGVVLDINEVDDIGRIDFRLVAADEQADTATINVTAVSAGNVYLNRIYTVEGLTIMLPYHNDTAVLSIVDSTEYSAATACATPFASYELFTGILTYNSSATHAAANTTCSATFEIGFIEEDEDNNIAAGETFNVTLGMDSTEDKPEVQGAVTFQIGNEHETDDDSDKYEGYVESPIATKTLRDDAGDLGQLTITYNGEEASGDIFIGEAGLEFSAASTGTSSSELGAITVTDAQVASVSDKNLIVIGGSCINTVAEELLGEAACTADFTALTGVSAGEALIKSFDRSDKTAVLVAGYNAADTTNAVTYLTNNDVDTTVGEAMKVTSATTAEAITATA